MSFGAAASRRHRMPASDGRCPCGGAAFAECCAPILAGAHAETPVVLMRSRYTAFAIGDIAHLRRTWHTRTRPSGLDLDDETTWTGLSIVDARGGAADSDGVVEFRARWRTPQTTGQLHERSRFTRVGQRWVYVDGEVMETA